MKKYGILLSAAEHQCLRILAAKQGVTMQDIARRAVLSALVPGGLSAPSPSVDDGVILSITQLVKNLDALTVDAKALLAQLQPEAAANARITELLDIAERENATADALADELAAYGFGDCPPGDREDCDTAPDIPPRPSQPPTARKH